MKKLVSMILTGVLVFSLAGCGNTGNTVNVTESTVSETESSETTITEEEVATGEAVPEASTKTIIDHAGVKVEIPTEINRVVVSSWPIASMVTVYLGGAEKIVGIAPVAMSAAKNGMLSEVYPEILEAETSFIDGSGEINMEELLKLNPDIVIGVGVEQAEAIREAGIAAVTTSASAWNYDVLETYEQWIVLLDQIFGGSDLADSVAEYSRQVSEDVLARVSSLTEEEKERVMILFTYSDETMTTSSAGFFGQSWCDLTGAINVGAEIDAKGSSSINMEQVYEWNPDVIIITNFTSAQPEDLYNNAIGGDDWSNVNAVKNGRVYKMPLGLYRSFTPGSDTPVTLQWFAKAVYPELFEDVDINQVTKDYFKDYFEIELTDKQIEKMFVPSREGSAY